MYSNLIKTLIGLGIALGVSYASAGEERFLTSMPTSNKTTAGEVTKSKKPGFQCVYVKQGPKGNANVTKNSKTLWFTDVPESQDAADDLLANGKKAVRCKLMIYDKSKHRMTTAELGEESDS